MANKQVRPEPLLFSPVLIFCLYGLLSLGLTYPLSFNLASTVPNDIGDPLLNTWILAWDGQALLRRPLALFNANIYYPLPQTLAYSEHLFSTALLALPVQLVSGEPVVAYNLSLLLSFPLAAFGMYLLAWHWTGQRRAAFIAGLVFGFAPYRFAAIAHLQLLTFQWLPFALLFLDKIIYSSKQAATCYDTPHTLRQAQGTGVITIIRRLYPLTHHHLALGLFLLLQLLASWYLALYSGLIIGLYLLVHLLPAQLYQPSKLFRLGLTFFLVLLFTLPFAWPYFGLVGDLRQARPLSLALSLAATPGDFLAAAPFNTFFGPLTTTWRNRPGFTEENTLFLGPVTGLLALVALVRKGTKGTEGTEGTEGGRGAGEQGSRGTEEYEIARENQSKIQNLKSKIRRGAPERRLGLILYFLFFTCSLSLLLTFPTPYTLLANLLPVSTVVRVPPRWMIPALLALAGLAGLGYMRAQSWLRGLAMSSGASLAGFLLCSLLLVAEALSVPIPLASVENRATLNPAYTWLAQQPPNFALIELPLHSAPAPEFPEVKRLYASTLGWWPLVNGYSGYTPPRQPALAQALAPFPEPPAVAALQALEAELAEAGRLDRSLPPRLYLLVHPGEAPFERSYWEEMGRWQAERQPGLLPVGQFAGDYLYRVLPEERTRFAKPPLATFRVGEDEVQLLEAVLLPPGERAEAFLPAPALILYWRTPTGFPAEATVFIHLRAADTFVHSQADGPPVSGHYPTSRWQAGEVIQDLHKLPEGEDFSQVDHLAIGLYDPATGERLPASGPGQALAEDSVVIPLPK